MPVYRPVPSHPLPKQVPQQVVKPAVAVSVPSTTIIAPPAVAVGVAPLSTSSVTIIAGAKAVGAARVPIPMVTLAPPAATGIVVIALNTIDVRVVPPAASAVGIAPPPTISTASTRTIVAPPAIALGVAPVPTIINSSAGGAHHHGYLLLINAG